MRPDNRLLSPWLHLEVMATLTFMLVYIAGVYFHAATASLSDAYQPGLSSLRRYVQPDLTLWALPLIAYGLKSVHLAKIAQRCALVGLACCVLLYVLCWVHSPEAGSSWVLPADRTLAGTIHQSLFNPSFSNRSLGSIAGSAILAAMAWLLGASIERKLKQRASATPRG
jgi:hypothetical protein